MIDTRRLLAAVREPTRTRPDIDAINGIEEYERANFDSWYFHVFEKTLLHIVLRVIPTPPPESWPGIFTGSRQVLAQFLLDEWFRYDREERRNIILEKVFYFGLKVYEFDSNYREVFEFLLYRLLTRKDLQVPFQARDLDPANWFMDANPKIAGRRGRFTPHVDGPPFTVLGVTDSHITLDRETKRPIICAKSRSDMLDETWYALDTRNIDRQGDRFIYPILGQGKNLLDVSKAYTAATGETNG